MDPSEIHARRLNAKEGRMPKLREFAFPFADGTKVKFAGWDNGFRKSTLIQVSLAQGEEHNEVLRESQKGLNHQTKKRMTQTPVMISRILLRILIPLKYLDVVRRTDATVDVLLESRIDNCWNVDGDRELPGRGPVSPSSHYWTQSPGGDQQKVRQHPGPIIMARSVVMYVEMISTRRRRHWAVEKQKLDNARKLIAVLHIDPEWHGIQGHREKCAQIVGRWNPLCQANKQIGTVNDTHVSWRPTKKRHCVLGGLNPEIMDISLLRSGSILWISEIQCTNSFLRLKKGKSRMRQALLTKGGEARKIACLESDKSHEQKRGHRKVTKRI